MIGIGLVVRPVRRVVAVVRGAGRTIAAVPDLVEAVLVLPKLSRQLDEIRDATSTLPDILVELERVHADTTSLPTIDDALRRIDAGIAELHVTVTKVEANTHAVEQLAEVALPLQGAALRVGRFADRLPQRRGTRPRGPVEPDEAPPA